MKLFDSFLVCLLVAVVSLTQQQIEAFAPSIFGTTNPFTTTTIKSNRKLYDSTTKLAAVINTKQDNVVTTKNDDSNLAVNIGKKILATMLGSFVFFSAFGGDALAFESRIIGEISGSGIVFKDTLVVESFDDPKVQGVTLYISNFQRPLTERIQKDFFTDPSYTSVGCAKTGPVKIADNIATGKGGEEVFEESRSLLFKTLRVQRIYDQQKKSAVYVTYNTRFDKNSDSNKSRFKSSICVVNLD